MQNPRSQIARVGLLDSERRRGADELVEQRDRARAVITRQRELGQLAQQLRKIVRELRELELELPVARIARRQILMYAHSALVIGTRRAQSLDVLGPACDEHSEIVVD